MTLGNMRADGVRSLLASCHKCHYEIIIEADHWLDRMEVSSFGPHRREQPPRATLTGAQWR
jgi:hypothetical protein